MSGKQVFEVEATQSATVKLTTHGWMELIAKALGVDVDEIRYNHVPSGGPAHWFTMETQDPVGVAKRIKDRLS